MPVSKIALHDKRVHNGMMHTSVIWTPSRLLRMIPQEWVALERNWMRRKTILFIYPWISIMSFKLHCLAMESRFMNTNFQAFKYLCHCVWKSQKKSHSTLRAKRALFIFWVDKSSLKMPKMFILANFWKLKACGQTVLPEGSLLKGQKLMEKAQIQKRQFEWFSKMQCH